MHTRWADVGRGMPSFPLESIHNRTTLGVASYHRPLTADTIGRRRASRACKAIGQHTLLDEVESDIPSLHLDNTHGGLMLGVTFHQRPWTEIHGQNTLGVACHHDPCPANTNR